MYDDAIYFCERALDVRIMTLGEKHSETVATHEQLKVAHHKQQNCWQTRDSSVVALMKQTLVNDAACAHCKLGLIS